MPRDVRTHTRRTASGKTTTVHHHTRKGTRRGPNPGHAGKLGRRAVKHHRRGRKAKAAMLLFVAAVEVFTWFTFGTTAWIFTLIAGVLVLFSTILTW
jgi:hypothetical protein